MYVIYAVSGHEDDVIRQLGKIGYTAYAPKRILKQRKNGIYYYITQILFPSYVFIDIKKISPKDYYEIRSMNGVGYFLSTDNLLPKVEEEYIRAL